MNPPQNTGSFGAAAGGMTPELQAAIQRRGPQGGASSAVTGGAPTLNPQTQPAQTPTSSAPQPAPTATGGPAGGQVAPTTAPLPFSSPEALIILKSMASRLKNAPIA